MDIISEKINNINTLHLSIKQYVDKIPKFNKEYNEKIDVNLHYIEKLFKQLKKDKMTFNEKNSPESATPMGIFVLMGTINEIVYNIKEIVDSIEIISIRHQKQFVLNISEADLQYINKSLNNILNLYNIYEKLSNTVDIQVIKLFAKLIDQQLKWDKSIVIKNINILTEAVLKNLHAVSLYAFIVQNILTNCISYNQHTCDYILTKVEIVKNNIMLSSNSDRTNISTNLIHSNPRINSFGLTPHGNSMQFIDLMKSIKINAKNISDLTKVAKKENICIVVLNNIIKNPIEFSLWNLVNIDKSKKYTQPPEMGITQKLIDRTGTINFKKAKKTEKWNFKTKYYGSIDSEFFIVLENINGQDFRLFSIYSKDVNDYQFNKPFKSDKPNTYVKKTYLGTKPYGPTKVSSADKPDKPDKPEPTTQYIKRPYLGTKPYDPTKDYSVDKPDKPEAIPYVKKQYLGTKAYDPSKDSSMIYDPGTDTYIKRIRDKTGGDQSDDDIIGGGIEFKIHRNQIYEFVEFVKNKGINKNQSRCSMYHDTHEKHMTKNMFLPINFDVNTINIDSRVFETKYIIHELHTKLINEFNSIVKKKYKGGVSIKTDKDFGQIIHMSIFSDIFNSVLIRQYNIFMDKHSNNFPQSETFHTFLMNLLYLNRQFNRKLHDIFTSMTIDKGIYTDISKNNKLQNIFEEIITHSIRLIISDKNNIYQKLIYKNALLALEIIR
jgi:hypothetical protein